MTTVVPSFVGHEIDIMFTRAQIEERIKELATEISDYYRPKLDGKPLVVVGILKGACMFMAELLKGLDVDNVIDFMRFSSYQGTHSTGNVQTLLDISTDVAGRHVLVVEDILDTGVTFAHMLALIKTRNPASLRTVVLLHKKERTILDVQAEHVGFVIPDKFVVGYGLDYDERLRSLPFIGVLHP